ncbi:purine-binding chemotaxis protein CheW [Rhodobium orientis]|uniref:Chemotaxis protein CheW n=1 Tax=Rhodobium orientis TaxID=34017 RepID=A0A327JSZ2_9HYPH|nr:chemotaxis protein CheW [Rhodobium orientis]MBB4303053.1 purine-binding chemotaxis protein CheW [Rhodobium orientis]MBK5947984.1 chemotaxis protein CheW [Rhodobium orientis]RAI29397.1 chemotaxis protein CheW [Rhodobium orientis]
MSVEVIEAANSNASTIQYVTVVIADQLFGLPIEQVHDVFMPDRMTRVPLSPAEVAGVLNLRGRIVTAIDMRRRLNLPPREEGASAMAVGIEFKGESYGLIIDTVGEVLNLPVAEREPNPTNLDPRWGSVSKGVHRLEGRLMVILDVSRLLETLTATIAA